MDTEAKRNTEDTWALEDIFSTDDLWREAVERVDRKLPEYDRFKGKLSESGELLYECLKLDEEIGQELEKIRCYARQKSDQDTRVAVYQELSGRAEDLCTRAAQASSFIQAEMIRTGEEKVRRMMEAYEPLKKYKHMFDIVWRKKDHILSDQEESLLAAAGFMSDGAADVFRMFQNADLVFTPLTGPGGEKMPLTNSSYAAYMQSGDREIRRQAYTHMYETYRAYENTLAAMFAANVKQHIFYSRARRYPSSRAYALSGSAVPEQVYDTLIETVHEFLPVMYRYVSLRKKALKVDRLRMYDVYAPLCGPVSDRYPFEEAKQIVKKALGPMGEEYLSVLCQGFENRWIDVYERKGKRSGAYSSGPYGVHPYVLLNYNGTLDHVFTLAHEMGHAMHSYYSDHTQPYCYAGYHIFVAEVASACNEALLTHYMLDHAKDRKEEACIVNHYLDSFRGTMFRQTMFAEFEKMTHSMAERGKALTAERLCSLWHELNALYFGKEMELDSWIDMEWSRIPHFYTPFYVYQYATGFAAAAAISRKILNREEGIVERYRQFLSGGSSMDCIDLLKLCGADMTGPGPVKEALRIFEEYLERLERLLQE